MSKKNKHINNDRGKTMADAEKDLKKDPKIDEVENLDKDEEDLPENVPSEEVEDKVPELEAKIAELEALVSKMKDDDLRRAADTENYKKRLRQDKENAIKYANEQLIGDLLSPLDNFARAIEAADSTSDFEAMKKGVVMVEDQMLSMLKSKWGLEMIDAKDKPFDPNTMEAYTVQEKEGIDKEMVIQEFAKGWILNGKVLRTAKVMVGKPKSN